EGEWAIDRTGDEKGRTKLVLRKTGGNAKEISAKRDALSALSGRTMEQIAGTRKPGKHSARLILQDTAAATPQKSAKQPMVPAPRFVAPMKATAVAELPQGDDWIYEVKWDGYRA